MKTKGAVTMFLVAITLAFSTTAKADTLPLGAVRFNQATQNYPPIVDVPKGKILVITDIITLGFACTFLDGPGPDWKIVADGHAQIHLQSGIDFTTQLRTIADCRYVTISGYLLDAPQ